MEQVGEGADRTDPLPGRRGDLKRNASLCCRMVGQSTRPNGPSPKPAKQAKKANNTPRVLRPTLGKVYIVLEILRISN